MADRNDGYGGGYNSVYNRSLDGDIPFAPSVA